MKLDNFRSRDGFAEGIFRDDLLRGCSRRKPGNLGEIGRRFQSQRGS
jgi:hypothetical protein